MMKQDSNFFRNMVDEMVYFSEHDPKLAEGLKWIDEESKKRGISFYDMVFHVLHEYDVSRSAGKWLKDKLN